MLKLIGRIFRKPIERHFTDLEILYRHYEGYAIQTHYCYKLAFWGKFLPDEMEAQA